MYWDIRGTAPRILNVGIRWRWVVSFTPRLLYTRDKKTSGTHCIGGGGVGRRAGLEAVA